MLVVGCGSGPKGSGAADPKALGMTAPPKMGQVGAIPEAEIQKFKNPQDKVNYLRGLDTDSNFDPKKHTEMLEKYSKDPNPDVAQAAKDLLDKAK